MGEVYRARDTRLDRTVAAKVLHSGFGSQPDARQRFEREARAVSNLNHPHICTLHDIGQQDSIDFLVMECLEGETLQSRLQKGPFSIEQTVRCGIEISSALAEAHGQGTLHRDVKPANIMITKNGASYWILVWRNFAVPIRAILLVRLLRPFPLIKPQKRTILGTVQNTCPLSNSKARRWTHAPTYSPWAWCCMKWLRVGELLQGLARLL